MISESLNTHRGSEPVVGLRASLWRSAMTMMRSALLLAGLLCACPAWSAAEQELLPSRMVTLTPTNQSGLILTVTLTNGLKDPIEGRVYAHTSTNRTDVSSGLAPVDWILAQPTEQERLQLANVARMWHRFGLGTVFELKGGETKTVNVTIRSGFSKGIGIRLGIQYLPPGVKPKSADWSRIRVLTGEILSSGAERGAPPNAAQPHR